LQALLGASEDTLETGTLSLDEGMNRCHTELVHQSTKTMGTRSRIGIQLPDFTVVSAYCHYDGYPSGNGKELVEHYQNRDDVQKLIDGGSMSSLRTEQLWGSRALRQVVIDETGHESHNIVRDKDDNWMYSPIRTPQPLYHTERGEELEVTHTSFDEFVNGNSGEEYAYMFDLNDNWKAFKLAGWDNKSVEKVDIPNYVTA